MGRSGGGDRRRERGGREDRRQQPPDASRSEMGDRCHANTVGPDRANHLGARWEIPENRALRELPGSSQPALARRAEARRMSTISLPATRRVRSRALSIPAVRPELAALLVLAGVLYLWALDRNGFANEYYSAAVRAMSTNWHAFLYGSFDTAGVMTVDKPPLALWVQALSARAFGFSSWSILVPQALMGVATVGLTYDMTRRYFGRVAGFAAGLALVLTPVTVAIARHNNPDALLVLCCTAALWFLVRGLEDGRIALARPRGRRGRSRLRGQDGRGAARGARHGCRVGVGGAAQPRQGPAGRRRGDDCHRTGLAAPDVAHSGGRPPVDLGHERQQHLVADPRLQRPRPPVRPGRRTRRHGRRRHDVRRRARPAATAQRGARRPGRLAARGRARRRRRAARAHAPEADRRAHRLADRGRRHVPDDRRRLQPRRGHLPSLLRGPARAVHCRARRRDRRGHARQPLRRGRGSGRGRGDRDDDHRRRRRVDRGGRRLRRRAARERRLRPQGPRVHRRGRDGRAAHHARELVGADARPCHERHVPRRRRRHDGGRTGRRRWRAVAATCSAATPRR